MGNAIFKNKIPESTISSSHDSLKMDIIATHYILSMDADSLRKMQEKEYCEDLIDVTGEVIDEYFTESQVDDTLNRIHVSSNYKKDSKKKKCKIIAKFYIQSAYVYSMIMTTLSPDMEYNNFIGEEEKRDLYKNTPLEVYLGLGSSSMKIYNNSKSVFLKTIVNKTSNTGTCKGIDELVSMYFDDEYDYKTNTFQAMTENTHKQFQKDMEIFNSIVSNRSEIKDGEERESKSESLVVKGIPNRRELVSKYANTMKLLVHKTTDLHTVLIKSLGILFDKFPKKMKKEEFIINTKLDINTLHELMVIVRGTIGKYYMSIGDDLSMGMKLYEALVESILLSTAQSQIKSLHTAAEQLYNSCELVGTI